jgi:hypothetical protein
MDNLLYPRICVADAHIASGIKTGRLSRTDPLCVLKSEVLVHGLGGFVRRVLHGRLRIAGGLLSVAL